MKKTIKKIFGVCFIVAMFLCVTALFASAETWNYNNKNYDLQVEGDFQYSLVKKVDLHENEADCDGGAILVKYTGTASSVAIPTTLGGEPVFYIYGASFKDNTALQTVTIGENVRIIGGSAFENCTGLQTVLIAKNVDRMYGSAFNGCTALKTVTFQKGTQLVNIGERAFHNCTSLNNFTIPETVETIGNLAFYNCDSMIDIVIPDSVTSLGSGAFFGCNSLINATIGNSIETLVSATQNYGFDDAYPENWGSSQLADGIFEGCIALKYVVIGSAVETIGQDCFAGTALERLDIPDNVVTISTAAFINCKNLEKVVIGNGVISMANDIFRGDTALVDVAIGTGVISIGDWAFMDCIALPEIYIPSNVTSVGVGAFWNCTSLEKAIVGNGVTHLNTAIQNYGFDDNNIGNWGSSKLADGTFEGCINLKEVTLGSGIIAIGQDTFAGTQITSLTIPAKVSTLSTGAFAGATQLKDIYFTGNWPASVGDSIFDNISEGYTVHYINSKIGYDDLSYNKAAFTPVTVTFDNNNDDVFAAPTESQILSPEGGYVIEPINPTAFGYYFGGWYKDAECRQPWNFETDKVTSDTTLYAKWIAVDDVVPVRPENISTSAKDGNSITLTWSAVEGATGYNIYVDGVKVNSSLILKTEHKITGLESSTTYEIVVRAVNSKGESADSLIFAERTTDHIHAYGEWTIVKNETCNDDGEKTRKCECGNVEKEVIPSTGAHGFGEWYVSLEPTCVDKGEQTRVCSTCGTKETKELPLTIEHSFGNWIVVKEATKTEEGLKERTCKHCEKTETLAIPTLSSVLKGDANGDGKITAADARIVLRISAQLEKVDKYTQPFEVFDVNGDGKITASDARKVLRISAKLES